MQVSTWRSRPVQISIPCALFPWSIFVWNMKTSPSLDFIKRPKPPKPHRAKGDSPWSRKSGWTSQHRWTPKVALSAGQDSNDGHRCITLVYVYGMHEHQVWSLFRPEIPSSFATGMITHRIQSHRFSNSTFLPRFHCSTSTGAFSSGFSCGALAPQPIACRAMALEVDRAGYQDSLILGFSIFESHRLLTLTRYRI